jgi:hypothetical protein
VSRRRYVYVLSGLVAGFCEVVVAQTIERAKLTDNDLSCQQIYAESQQMDTAMQLSAPTAQASAAPATTPAPSLPTAFSGLSNPAGNNLTLSQMHAPTAAVMTQHGLPAHMQQQIANNMAAAQSSQYRPGAVIQPTAVVQAGGMASMLGAMAGNMAVRPAATTGQVAPAQQPIGNTMAGQAKARKEHLTGLFLSRGCKMSELQK